MQFNNEISFTKTTIIIAVCMLFVFLKKIFMYLKSTKTNELITNHFC